MVDGTELEILKLVRGPLYRRRRDQLLSQAVDAGELLAHSRNQPDKRIEIVAAILAGHKEHGPAYEAFTAEILKVNVAEESQKVAGLSQAMRILTIKAQRDLGEAILPFCWEQILKFVDELPEWHVGLFLDIIGAIPAEASIEVMVWLLEQATTAELLDAAHQTMLRLPFHAHKARFVQVKAGLTMRVFIYEDLLARIKAGAGKP